MYYVIETENVGPNALDPERIDTHTYDISTQPATGNMDGRAITDGWCGTTNDWAVYARGEYETQEAAEEAIRSMLSATGYREEDLDDMDDVDRWEAEEDGVVARFRVGKYIPLSPQGTAQGLSDSVSVEVSLSMDDSELDALADELINNVRAEFGQDPDRRTLDTMLREQRDSLQRDGED